MIFYAHLVKKSHKQDENTDTCEVLNMVLTSVCPLVSFSNGRGMIKLHRDILGQKKKFMCKVGDTRKRWDIYTLYPYNEDL